jgi:hypothetical protein
MHELSRAKSGGTIFGTARQALPDFDNDGFKYQALAEMPLLIKGPDERSAKTNNDGEFSLSGLPPGEYEVTPSYPNGLGPAISSKVSIHDKGCAEVSFVAQNDGVVEGNLLYADMKPAAGVYIRLKRIEDAYSGSWTQDLYVDWTNPEGYFHFEPVVPGDYVLGVNMDFPAQSPYTRKNFYPGKNEREEAEVIHIVGAQHIDGLRYVLLGGPDKQPPVP